MTLPENVEQAISEKGGMDKLLLCIPDSASLTESAEIYRALSDTLRLKILYLLTAGTLCVCVIKEVLQIADSKLSYHLTILKKAGLISSEQQGTWVLYTLTEKGEAVLGIRK
ncbi:MAG: winged helix-turn-helix transcriptional regulator [Methanocorpusculum sp.]|nr:winged helix-turn-helix transcriptional regulator [Methanocorpusculum sp.]